MNRYILTLLFSFTSLVVLCQSVEHDFRIRTITAGITLSSLSDTSSIIEAVEFLKEAKNGYKTMGYEVQTIRISTQNLHEFLNGKTHEEALPYLIKFDQIAQRDNIGFAIGWILSPDKYDADIAEWVIKLINQTQTISFSLPISSTQLGIHTNSIRAAAEITQVISKNSKGGEGNFRFTASANCPAGIPFFPAAYHEGPNSFAIGLESPNILTRVFSESNWNEAKHNLKLELETQFKPIQVLAEKISKSSGWIYDGIDTSPAPGLDASIGQAIETLTKHPFGGPSTLRACALITDVLKNLELKTCGYSGLMLPVIEDKILAKRAMENRFTLQELLLFSSVSGTGLDVIPLPGNTTIETVERIYYDVAALSLKYTNKALSARLFLIPDKVVGDLVEFDNPYLTPTTVMKIE
ncbi:MAG: DUF711 family protein [Bacteroidetes bacterium]|nr:DUF711 family protein [Bacteroidota bacterium]